MFWVACVAALFFACVTVGRAADAPGETEAWAKIQTFKTLSPKAPQRQADGSVSKEDLLAYRTKAVDLMVQLLNSASDFSQRFPKSTHEPEALEIMVVLATQMSVQDGAQFDPARKIASELAKRDDLPSTPALLMSISRLRVLQSSSDKTLLPADNMKQQLAVAETFLKKHPENPNVAILFFHVADYAKAVDAATAVELFKKAAKLGDAQVKEEVANQLKRLAQLGSMPMFKATAIDGRQVDLAKLKGKVVLLNFWATWAAPCLQIEPLIVKTYASCHAKGFEIVGVSVDRNLKDLQDYVKQSQTPWPQCFDDKGEICAKFQIEGLPTLLLIDKDGKVAVLNAKDDLQEKVEALLAGKKP